MADDIDGRLKAAQTQITAATTRQARAEVARDNARADVAKARETLSSFGVKTNADLKRVQAELDEEVETKTAEVERLLTEAGA